MRNVHGLAAVVLGFALVAASAAEAAVITVTDCVNDPHIVAVVGTHVTTLDVGSDDLVLHCALTPLAQTDHFDVSGHDVTIEKPGSASAGSISTNSVTATGTLTVSESTVSSTDTNGRLLLQAAGDVSFVDSTIEVGDATHDGDLLTVTCTGTSPKCTITGTGSTLKSRHIEIEAQGDVVFSASSLLTNSPIDTITIRSDMGNVILGVNSHGGGNTDCCSVNARNDGDSVVSGNEGNLYILAFGRIDLSGSNIVVAEDICGRSGVDDVPALSRSDACGPCPGAGAMATVPADIDLSTASIRNDIGKPGDIVFCADETRATIDIDQSLLIDDDVNGPDLSELNGCATKPRSGCPNVTGTPNVDS